MFYFALMNVIYMFMRVCVCVHYTHACVFVYEYHINTYECACLRSCIAASALASRCVLLFGMGWLRLVAKMNFHIYIYMYSAPEPMQVVMSHNDI